MYAVALLARRSTNLCMPTHSKWQSLPTEAINPVSLAIDKTPVRDIIEMVVNEDRKVIAAVLKEKERIAHGIEIITQVLKKGGRVIFIGAGTSGRLGVVEASEMPPTFGTRPSTVRAPCPRFQACWVRLKLFWTPRSTSWRHASRDISVSRPVFGSTDAGMPPRSIT